MLNLLKKEILPYAKEYCESNWDEILTTIKNGLSIFYRALREGILALEDGADDWEPEYITSFLRLVIDGNEDEVVEEIILNLFYAGNYSGLDAYLFLLYGTMVMCIAKGNKQLFVESVKSLIPESYHERLTELENLVKADNEEKEKIFGRIADGRAEEIFDFKLMETRYDDKIVRERDRDVQGRLKKLKVEVIADALHYSTKKIVNKLFKNMDNRLVMEVVHRLRDLGEYGCSPRDAREAWDTLKEQSRW